MEFLAPLRKGTELNQVEKWKLERNPLDVYDSVINTYSKNGVESILSVEGEQERLKWVGLYPQKQGGDAFMMRVKVPGGRITAQQAEKLGELSLRYAKSPSSDAVFGNCYCDITTRQSIQLHWLPIGDIPTIWHELEGVGLTTVQACGDSSRNVLCCPVSGIDANEIFDAYPIATAISEFFTGNREYSNLPRKFKISVTGCQEDCAQAEINDIGMWPAKLEDGTLGFNLLVGGGLSDGPRMASDIDVFVPLEQAVEATRGIAQLFGELGNRENRGLSRMRYLVQELGPEGFRSELEKRVSFGMLPAGESLTKGYRGDHIGIHPQKEQDVFYAGLNVLVGRLKAPELIELARLAATYGNSEIRLTTDQNAIISGISKDKLEEFLGEPVLKTISPFPKPFERGAVACTGNEFCRFAIVETKAHAAKWAKAMDEKFSSLIEGETRLNGSATSSWQDKVQRQEQISSQVVRMHFSGCPASCAQPQIGDIGFRGDTAHRNGEIVEAVDIGLGGSLGSDASFIDWVEGAVPSDEVPQALVGLFEGYFGQRREGESFRNWTRRVPNPQLRKILSSGAK